MTSPRRILSVALAGAAGLLLESCTLAPGVDLPYAGTGGATSGGGGGGISIGTGGSPTGGAATGPAPTGGAPAAGGTASAVVGIEGGAGGALPESGALPEGGADGEEAEK